MNEPNLRIVVRPQPKATADDSKMIVQLTVGELRELVAQWIKAANVADRQRKLLTPEKLALKLSVPVTWVYEQSRQGNIPTHRIGRYPRFDLAEVLEAQKKRTP